MLYEFHEADRMSPALWKEKLEEICGFDDLTNIKPILESFGLSNNKHLACLSIFAAFEKATAEDIAELCEDFSPQMAAKALRWAYLEIGRAHV